MSTKSLTLLLATTFAFVLLPGSVAGQGGSLTTVPPVSPVAPHNMQECSQLQAQWSQLVGQLQSAHQNCLDARANDPNVPGSGSGPGSRCSRTACQALHNVMFSMQSQAPNKVAECQSEVSQYQSAVQEQQKQAQENAEAAAAETQARTQANQAALQHAKDLQIEKNANNRDPVEYTPLVETTPQSPAPVQASEGNARPATDAPPSGTQSADSQPGGLDPTAALVQQIEGGSVPAQIDLNVPAGPQPSPSPNTAIDTLQKDTFDYSPPTLQQYIAADLSLENAQKAVEFNSPTSDSSRALSDLEQQLASSPGQEYRVPGPFNQDLYQIEANDKAVLDEALVKAVGSKAVDIGIGTIGFDGWLLWITASAMKGTGKATWDAACLNPKNSSYCATTLPTPQPNDPIPARSGGVNQQFPPVPPAQSLGTRPQ